MSIDPNALLRALGSGVRPAQTGGTPARAGAGGLNFEDFMQKAEAGGVESGLAVRVSRQAGVDLSPSQLARLSIAADRAEAAGATRALVSIDGMILQMDVGLRTITGKADLNATKVLTGVDAVVTVAPEAGAAEGAGPFPASTLLNAGLLKVLGGRKPTGA